MSDDVHVTVTPSPDHACVVLNGQVVAESSRTVLVRQSDHDFDSRYFPPHDVRLDLFERMRAGEFPDGSRVLRARIDMASPNLDRKSVV